MFVYRARDSPYNYLRVSASTSLLQHPRLWEQVRRVYPIDNPSVNGRIQLAGHRIIPFLSEGHCVTGSIMGIIQSNLHGRCPHSHTTYPDFCGIGELKSVIFFSLARNKTIRNSIHDTVMSPENASSRQSQFL